MSERDEVEVVESSPYRASDAELEIVDADGGERESVTITEAAPRRLSDAALAILGGASSTDGFGPTTEADATIDGTSTLVEPPGEVPEPDGTVGNDEYVTDETITIETSTDPEDLHNPGAVAVSDAFETASNAAENAAEEAREKMNQLPDELQWLLDHPMVVVGVVLFGAVLWLARPLLTIGASATEAVS